MKTFIKENLKIFLLFLLLIGFISLLDFISDRKAKNYLQDIANMKGSDIESISVNVRDSEFCMRSIIFSEGDFDVVAAYIKSFSILENQRDQLAPKEIFEFQINLKNGKEPICFLLFNSIKYNGVVRFSGNCRSMPKRLDVKNDSLLRFVHKKCTIRS
jgi:hypothetical protein